MELPYGLSFMDTIKAKGINVKSVEVKQKSQSTLLNSLTKQQEVAERRMDALMEKIIAANVIEKEDHILWDLYRKEANVFQTLRDQISLMHSNLTQELSDWKDNVIDLSIAKYNQVDSTPFSGEKEQKKDLQMSLLTLKSNTNDSKSNSLPSDVSYETPVSMTIFNLNKDKELMKPMVDHGNSYSNSVIFTDQSGNEYGRCMYGSKCILATKQTSHKCFINGCENWVCDTCNPFEYDDTFDNGLADRVCPTCYARGEGVTKQDQSLTWKVII